jgi:REP element-mobilizing transposase RayT
MPDHYHVVLGLGEGKTLQSLMASLNRHTSRRINEVLGRRGQFWEKGFYDRALRDRREFDGFLEYMHLNPVKEGFADCPGHWRFSSANAEFADLIDWEWLGVNLRG